MAGEIRFEVTREIDVNDLKAFYDSQGSSTPQSIEKLSKMVANSVCFVTAREADGRLIGIARGVADGVRGYLTECKLDPSRQGPAAVTHIDGRIEHDQYDIAGEMATRVIRALAEAGCERIDVLAYGTEVDFCEEFGFRKATGLVPMHLNVKDFDEHLGRRQALRRAATAGAAAVQ